MVTRTEVGIRRRRAAYLTEMQEFDANRGPMPNWRDYLVRPVAEAIVAQLGRGFAVEVGPPMGLGARVGVTITRMTAPKNAEGESASAWLCFEPGRLAEGEIRLVDWSRKTRSFPPGSIGWINGLEYTSTPRPALSELVDRVKAQLAGAHATPGGE